MLGDSFVRRHYGIRYSSPRAGVRHQTSGRPCFRPSLQPTLVPPTSTRGRPRPDRLASFSINVQVSTRVAFLLRQEDPEAAIQNSPKNASITRFRTLEHFQKCALTRKYREPNSAQHLDQEANVTPSPAPFFMTGTFRYCHQLLIIILSLVAGTTGLEPATSAVTGQRSNQLSYVPKKFFNNLE